MICVLSYNLQAGNCKGACHALLPARLLSHLQARKLEP